MLLCDFVEMKICVTPFGIVTSERVFHLRERQLPTTIRKHDLDRAGATARNVGKGLRTTHQETFSGLVVVSGDVVLPKRIKYGASRPVVRQALQICFGF